MIRILVIEDEERVGTLIRRGLEESGYEVTLARDGNAGLKLALTGEFELVITDIILPGVDGLSLSRSIREALPDIPVLMLTALDTTDHKVEGFEAGADDYLVKPFDLRELQVRIKALLKRYGGRRQQPSRVLQYAGLQMDLRAKTVNRDGVEISLTPKEFRLLEYFLQRPEVVVSRTELAENVWDTHYDTGTNFIDVYINYLRKKIDKDFAVKLIHTRTGMGFILKAG
ncbi:DNA-binding response regulator, OmpR family, contains REC and winged-helix (wHTH) domain [Chitinophaga jiangningensis]|uniref:DNA-binding response regulator, OmpR family, contains REC and winged-helix (WHTH) domain n=1 Tax=Chitinophaga jiangningensis TaxID=1419482 RepID=A0A1M6Y2Q8_9BACT|nr:response regulator transcription factor [Chitinophaga jiangningensis]SHL12409.1 DNA-binding response regulator, OmpR family, contains REC and winged-helix (wHTH) domain [Chitinophaga jiangningensis]